MADINTDQVLPFTITPRKADGSPGEIDAASVIVASSDETVIAIIDLNATASTIDGKVNTVAAGGPARFTVTADADLGTGVSTITGVSEDINVAQGPSSLASTFTITFGPPAPKAPTVTPI